MSDSNDRRRLIERAQEAGRAHAEAAAGLTRRSGEPLRPGDLVLDRSTAELPVEWAVIDAEAGDGEPARRLLVVPADTQLLRGPADAAVPADAATGPLTLRCAYGLWVEPGRLDPALRRGRLPDTVVAEARSRHRAATEAGGSPRGTPLEREAAADPEYRHWVETVLEPARRALEAGATAATGAPPAAPAGTPPAAGSAPTEPTSLAKHRRHRGFSLPGSPWALAASVLLVVTLGLVTGLVRQNRQTGELRDRSERLSREIATLEERRGALIEESQGLRDELARTDAEHQAELTAQAREAEQAAERAKQRIATLQRDLDDALTPRPKINVPVDFLAKVEDVRGDPYPLDIPPGAREVALALDYIVTEPYADYRIELRRKGRERPLWTAQGLEPGDNGFGITLPAAMLPPGEYRIEIFGLRADGESKSVAEYEVVVRAG